MIRTLNVILLAVCIGAMAAVYVLKYQTETIADHKRDIEVEIARQETNLSVLRADWAYLSQPSYVGPLATRHAEALDLEVISAKQFGSIDDIPMRPARPNDAQLDALFLALEAGVDPIGDKIAQLIAE